MLETTLGSRPTTGRTAVVLLALLSLLVSVMAVASPVLAKPDDKPPDDPRKVFVCKYVGTPGVDERLQLGGNPISVSVSAIPGFVSLKTVVGMKFPDQHGQSIVIAVNSGQPTPNVSECPVPDLRVGSITIIKNAVPDAAQDFAFTTTGTGLSSFLLDDDADAERSNQQNFTGLAAGSYSVTETATAGWTLTSITCSAGGTVNGSTANIVLAAGANVTCTFVNTLNTVALTPTLVIDKVADTETITITGSAGSFVANPSVVTWTLSYTLTNGPVTNVVITDLVPAGFTFLDASNGGTSAGNTVTFNLGTLTTSGSVIFRTTVNPATVARGTVTNTATIVSTQTGPDTGDDSVTVSQTRADTLGGSGTGGSTGVPNTSTAADAGLTAVAVLGALTLLSAGVFVSATMGRGRRRR